MTTAHSEPLTITLPLTRAMRETADRFAQQQPTSEKAEQVRRNTLAVYAVNHYCQLLSIPTDLSAADCWHPLKRLAANVADLELVNIGRLECRPVEPNSHLCQVPPEVWADRIGYVAVQLDEMAAEATLRGFFLTATAEQMPLQQLRSLDQLIDRIEHLRQTSAPQAAHLGQWLIGQVTAGWQSVESLLDLLNAEPAFAFRGAIASDAATQAEGSRQAKLIHLSTSEVDYPLALVVEIIPRSEGRRSISIQVHTTEAQTVLPEGLRLRAIGQPHLRQALKLTSLDSANLAVLETQARQADDYIQLRLRGIAGEQFHVQISLDGATWVEDFVV